LAAAPQDAQAKIISALDELRALSSYNRQVTEDLGIALDKLKTSTRGISEITLYFDDKDFLNEKGAAPANSTARWNVGLAFQDPASVRSGFLTSAFQAVGIAPRSAPILTPQTVLEFIKERAGDNGLVQVIPGSDEHHVSIILDDVAARNLIKSVTPEAVLCMRSAKDTPLYPNPRDRAIVFATPMA